jgi:hypothetical protein
MEWSALAPATLRIFNMLGQEIRTFKYAPFGPGHRAIAWDGTDANGIPVPTGVYLCRLESAGHLVLTKLYRIH